MIEGKHLRKNSGKMLDGLTMWLHMGQGTDVTKSKAPD